MGAGKTKGFADKKHQNMIIGLERMLCREDEFIYMVIFIINVVVVPISMYENLFLLLKKILSCMIIS